MLSSFIIGLFYSFLIQESNNEIESFNLVLNRFSQDNAFQVSRVIFPFDYIQLNEETFERDTSILNKQNYRLHNYYYVLYDSFEAYLRLYNNFKCEAEDTDERVYRWRGFTGMDERYFFRRKEGKWYLVAIAYIAT